MLCYVCVCVIIGSGLVSLLRAVLRRAERASVRVDGFMFGALLEGYAAKGDAFRAAAWLERLRRSELSVDEKALKAVARSGEAQGEAAMEGDGEVMA